MPTLTSDLAYVILARFGPEVQIWRGGVFDSFTEAEDEWNEYYETLITEDVEKLSVVELRTDTAGAVWTRNW